MAATLHSDEPTTDERLGRQALVDEIASVAATAAPPLVLGVHGDWGSGKTSFMLRVKEALETGQYQDGIVTVRFEAWRYQNEPAPVVALLQEMRRGFAKSDKLKRRLKKYSETTIRALLNSLSDLAKLVQLESLPLSPEKIQLLGEQWEKEHLENQLVVDNLQQNLQEAIEVLLPDSKKTTPRVVVFIDDLDRCNPEMAYRLLEGLKIYLNLKNCVFVLAMNQQVVVEAIAGVMKKESHDARVKLHAEAYLEKLCANIWRLPPPPLPARFFVDLLDDETAKSAIAKAAIETKHGFLPPNPRRLKALANLFNRFWPVAAKLPEEPLLPLRVLALAYVYQFHSELFQRWRHDYGFFLRMQQWLRGSPGTEEKAESCFAALTLPTGEEGDPGDPTGENLRIAGRFPDPAAPGVFWIAPLWQQPGPLSGDTPEDYRQLLYLETQPS